jgi:23S rRNA (guanosine2251-2'-O)-methyltransferase
VLEALRGERPVRRVLLAAGVRPNPAIAEALRLAGERGIAVAHLPATRLDAISPHAQGIAAEVASFPYRALEELLAAASRSEHAPLLLCLDGIQDPQNLGALLRTAEAAAVDGVVLPEHRAAGVTPAVVRASAGAAEHLAIARVTNLPRALATLKEAGLWVFGLSGDGDVGYTTARLDGPSALVIGGEGAGLGRLVRERCDQVLRLPMLGKVESLNAAVAASIVLYEALRQRGHA